MLKDCYQFPILQTLECVEVGVTTIKYYYSPLEVHG